KKTGVGTLCHPLLRTGNRKKRGTRVLAFAISRIGRAVAVIRNMTVMQDDPGLIRPAAGHFCSPRIRPGLMLQTSHMAVEKIFPASFIKDIRVETADEFLSHLHHQHSVINYSRNINIPIQSIIQDYRVSSYNSVQRSL